MKYSKRSFGLRNIFITSGNILDNSIGEHLIVRHYVYSIYVLYTRKSNIHAVVNPFTRTPVPLSLLMLTFKGSQIDTSIMIVPFIPQLLTPLTHNQWHFGRQLIRQHKLGRKSNFPDGWNIELGEYGLCVLSHLHYLYPMVKIMKCSSMHTRRE